MLYTLNQSWSTIDQIKLNLTNFPYLGPNDEVEEDNDGNGNNAGNEDVRGLYRVCNHGVGETNGEDS